MPLNWGIFYDLIKGKHMILNNPPFWFMLCCFVLVFYLSCLFEEKEIKKKKAKKQVKVIEHNPLGFNKGNKK